MKRFFFGSSCFHHLARWDRQRKRDLYWKRQKHRSEEMQHHHIRSPSCFLILARPIENDFEVLVMMRTDPQFGDYWDFPGGSIDPRRGTSHPTSGPTSWQARYATALHTTDLLCGSDDTKRPFKIVKSPLKCPSVPGSGTRGLRLPLSVISRSRSPPGLCCMTPAASYFFPVLLTPNEGKYWIPRAKMRVRSSVDESVGQFGFKWFTFRWLKGIVERSAYLKRVRVARWVRTFFVDQRSRGEWMQQQLEDQLEKQQKKRQEYLAGQARRNESEGVSSSREDSPDRRLEEKVSSSDPNKTSREKKKTRDTSSPLRARAPTFELPTYEPRSWTANTTWMTPFHRSFQTNALKVVTYNVLCDGTRYAHSQQHAYCPRQYRVRVYLSHHYDDRNI